MQSLIPSLLYILLASSVLHVAEEFLYPGGFYKEFKKMTAGIGLNISARKVIIINILFFSVIIMAIIYGAKVQVFGLSVIMLAMINGILHTIKSIQKRGYFPGFITSLLLYIPLGITALFIYPVTAYHKFIAVLLGSGMHLIPFLLLIFERGFRPLRKVK